MTEKGWASSARSPRVAGFPSLGGMNGADDASGAEAGAVTGGELLLLDNDQRIVELLTMFLEEAGYGVRTAASFGEARAALLERAPDLMLSDLDLGTESGRVELPRLAAEGLLPPTLVVSGYLDAQLEEELSLLDGVRGTLPKPFDLPQLLGRVEALLAELAELRAEQEAARAAGVEAGAGEAGEDDGWREVKLWKPEALRETGSEPAASDGGELL